STESQFLDGTKERTYIKIFLAHRNDKYKKICVPPPTNDKKRKRDGTKRQPSSASPLTPADAEPCCTTRPPGPFQDRGPMDWTLSPQSCCHPPHAPPPSPAP
ncbi:hypothetical protein Vafri_2597, partial [Volvox africanus]